MWENANTNLSVLLCKHSILLNYVTNLHNYKSTGIFKTSSFGKFFATFACTGKNKRYQHWWNIGVLLELYWFFIGIFKKCSNIGNVI